MTQSDSPSPSGGVAALPSETIYSVGTLRYNKNQLIVLFVWLMWNDFGIKLIESIGSLNGVLMRDHGRHSPRWRCWAASGDSSRPGSTRG